MCKHLGRTLRDRRGLSASIEFLAVFFVTVLLIGVATFILPINMVKGELDNYADKLCRTAEIAGRVGSETDRMAQTLTGLTKLSPSITWSRSGQVQLGDTIELTLETTYDIGISYFGSFPVQIKAHAVGQSEVFWK